MTDLLASNISDWLQFRRGDEPGVYRLKFLEHHLGNIFIRSLHGGVSGAVIEMSAEAATRDALNGEDAELIVTSNSVDYLRITRDADLIARTNIVRMSRRLSVVDVVCWQDDEHTPVVRGTVTIKLNRPGS